MPVSKIYLGADYGEVSVRHSDMIPALGSILFLHGLGDSRQAFREAFEDFTFDDYNLIAPDMPGCGSSYGGENYAIDSWVYCTEKILDALNVVSVVLVGHGIGADVCARLCLRNRHNRIKGLIAIEGTVTRDNLHMARLVSKGARGGRFKMWLKNDFLTDFIHQQQVQRGEPYRRFYESVEMMRPAVFLAHCNQAKELLYPNDQFGESLPLESFQQVEQPKLFCYGAWSFSPTARQTVEDADIPLHCFDKATHWVMVDQPQEFYEDLLLNFCKQHHPQPNPMERLRNWFHRRWLDWLASLEFPEKRTGLKKIFYFAYTAWRNITVKKRSLNELADEKVKVEDDS